MPSLQAKFQRAGDSASVAVLEVIHTDEITHVACGVKFFKYICERSDPSGVTDPLRVFYDCVRRHFKGFLKPPFHHQAREQAGFTEDWYMQLTKESVAARDLEQKQQHANTSGEDVAGQ